MKKLNPIEVCLQACADWGLIPTEFRQCMTWEEQVLWLSKFLNNTVIPALNDTIEATQEVQQLFIELKEYVDNYFDDLNVQEQINNKLDAMAEDGTLAEIINQEIFGQLTEGLEAVQQQANQNTEDIESIQTTLASDYGVKVHYPTTTGVSGSRHAIKFKDFTAIVDLGIKDYINNFIGYLVSNNMTTIKYVIITHFDVDHVAGDLLGFISFVENVNLDFTGCTFILPHTPDWTRTSGLDGQKELYEGIRDYLLGRNFTIVYPSVEGETITIDDGNKFQFFNVTDALFNDYYSIEASAGVTNYNNFSMVSKLLTTNNHSFVFAGDIESAAEANVADELGGYDVTTIPHHGASPEASDRYLQTFNPSIGVAMNTTIGTLYQNPLINQFADYNRTLFSSKTSGNVVIDGRDLGCYSENGPDYPKFDNIIQTSDDLNDFIKDGVYHYRATSAPSNSIPGYSNQFRLDVKEVTSGCVTQTLTGIRGVNDVWERKIKDGVATEWRCIMTPMLAGSINNGTATLTSSYTRLTFVEHRNSYSNIFSTDNGIKANVKIDNVELNAMLSMENLTAGDRVTTRIVKNNEDICHFDTIANGSQLAVSLHTITGANANDVFNVEVRNLGGNRGTVSNAYTYSALFAKML